MTKSYLNIILYFSFIIFFVSAVAGCKKDTKNEEPFNDGCYPPEIAEIIVKKCATSGCHNTISKDAAGGLDLSTWETMFLGNRNGAVVVPYRSDQSTLFFFSNNDTSLGITQLPTMPFNEPPLSTVEILTIRNWIDAGAPNCNGQIKFANSPNRKKFYIANQGCDLVGVHDAATKVVMRYIEVGNSPSIESPHMIKISPDGLYWYVVSLSGNTLQKYSTADDSFVAEVDINQGQQGFWNTFSISPDGSKAWVVDFSTTGRIAYVDLNNMQFNLMYSDPGSFTNPHGSMINSTGDFLYVTGQLGNSIFKWDVSNPMIPDYEVITINNSGGSAADPHEIEFSPDGTKYFVTCQGRDEVRVFDANTDTLVAVIPTAEFPLEMSVSPSKSLLFVSCEIGNSVSVIDMGNLTHVKDITVGYQPHGLAVDEVKNKVYVGNRNTPTSGGPPPHHTSSCGGRNGYLTIIDMNTLELVPGFKMELSVDPYSVRVKN